MPISTQHPVSELDKVALLTGIPIAIYFACFFYYSINAPQFDDFQTIIRSVITFDEAKSRLHWLLSQYGEHRIGYIRFIAIILQRLTGKIDFVWMGLIGNASLIGVVVILYRWFKQWGLERYFLPVPFILFQMNYHHNTFTAMMALQNLTILLWALITLWWVSTSHGWRLWAALATAVLAVFTSGNGLFVVITAILVLIYRCQWKYVAIWTLIGGGALMGYFWGLDMVRPSYNLTFLTTHALQLSAFAIFFGGSYFDLLPNVLMSSVGHVPFHSAALFYARLVLPFGMGLVLITASLLLIGRLLPIDCYLKQSQKSKVIRWITNRFVYQREASVFLAAVLLFILLTAGVVALGRLDIGMSQSFAIRYKIYAPLMLICCYAALLVNIRNQALRGKFYQLLLISSLVIGFNSYVQNLNQIQTNKRTAFSGLQNMAVNRSWAVYGEDYGNIDSVMQTAIDRHMYQINLAKTSLFTRLNHDLKRPCPAITVEFDTTALAAHLRVLHSPLDLSLLTAGTSEGPYFVVYNDQRQYLFPAQPDRSVVGNYQSGFHCDVKRTSQSLVPGVYKIAVMTTGRRVSRLYHTRYRMNLKAQR